MQSIDVSSQVVFSPRFDGVITGPAYARIITPSRLTLWIIAHNVADNAIVFLYY